MIKIILQKYQRQTFTNSKKRNWPFYELCILIYFLIDQQIACYFVHYSICLYHPPLFYATQTIDPFLTSRISANHEKGWDFRQSENPYNSKCFSSVESLLFQESFQNLKGSYFLQYVDIHFLCFMIQFNYDLRKENR